MTDMSATLDLGTSGRELRNGCFPIQILCLAQRGGEAFFAKFSALSLILA